MSLTLMGRSKNKFFFSHFNLDLFHFCVTYSSIFFLLGERAKTSTSMLPKCQKKSRTSRTLNMELMGLIKLRLLDLGIDNLKNLDLVSKATSFSFGDFLFKLKQ